MEKHPENISNEQYAAHEIDWIRQFDVRVLCVHTKGHASEMKFY